MRSPPASWRVPSSIAQASPSFNALAGHWGERAAAGFRVGSTSAACTRGIDVCIPDPSLYAGSNLLACGGTLVLLDSEGIASLDQDETYDAQIFSLALLLSSYFVLNSFGVIDEAAIDRLFLISQISKRVCTAATDHHPQQQQGDGESAGGDGGDGGDGSSLGSSYASLSRFFPPLLWLLRDFVLDLTDETGAALTPSAYMERALEARANGQRRAEERNDTRSAIRELFPLRHCATLIRPAADESQVRRASVSSELRPEFLAQMNTLRSEVLRAPPPNGSSTCRWTVRASPSLQSPSSML